MIANLHDLLTHELKDLHSAESQIIVALPKMIKATTNEQLQKALEEHLAITKQHLHRLETIGQEITFKVDEKVCEGMKGILAEGEKGLKEISDEATKDAAIIASAQKVEHYEIAAYGTAIEYAHQLELPSVGELLSHTINEEKQADATLSKLAKGNLFTTGINEMASEDLSDTEEEG